jgi:hypothetical protein
MGYVIVFIFFLSSFFIISVLVYVFVNVIHILKLCKIPSGFVGNFQATPESDIYKIRNVNETIYSQNCGGQIGFYSFPKGCLTVEIFKGQSFFSPSYSVKPFFIDHRNIYYVGYLRILFIGITTILGHNTPNTNGRIVLIYDKISKDKFSIDIDKSEPPK